MKLKTFSKLNEKYQPVFSLLPLFRNSSLIFRFSIARRPIYPGRRPNRYKVNLTHFQREPNASDEGNTSEYSVSPSSKSSTLDSNPDRVRILPNLSMKRPSDSMDGSSDSESEENATIITQVSFNRNEAENLV